MCSCPSEGYLYSSPVAQFLHEFPIPYKAPTRWERNTREDPLAGSGWVGGQPGVEGRTVTLVDQSGSPLLVHTRKIA